MLRTLTTIVIACVACALVACPGESKTKDPREDVESFEQRLELTIDGQPAKVGLERMHVYLVDVEEAGEDAPDIFEIVGPNAALVGSFPLDRRVGYEENWQGLIGVSVDIVSEGGDPREPKRSGVELNGTWLPVTGGRFTLREVREGFDAKTPLVGDLELELDDGRTLKGKLHVLGTSWG